MQRCFKRCVQVIEKKGEEKRCGKKVEKKRCQHVCLLKISRRHDEIDDHRLCRFSVENCAFHRVKLSLSFLAHLPHDGHETGASFALIEPRSFRRSKKKEKFGNYDYRSVENALKKKTYRYATV